MHRSRNIPEAETSSRAGPGGPRPPRAALSPASWLAVSTVGSLLGTKAFTFLSIRPQRLSRPVRSACTVDMQMNRFHDPPTCPPIPPPGFHINSPRGRGILCRACTGKRGHSLPACSLALSWGVIIHLQPRGSAFHAWLWILSPCASVVGGGLCVYLWKVCFSCGRLYLRPFGPGQRAPPSACTTPLGFESPTPLHMNSPQAGSCSVL